MVAPSLVKRGLIVITGHILGASFHYGKERGVWYSNQRDYLYQAASK